MMADISNAGYEITIEGITDCTSGPCSDIPFDLFLFDNTDDYNCYVEAVSIYDMNGTIKTCDFLETKQDIIFQQTRKHEMASNRFVSKEQPFADIFTVIDNTGWL